MLRVTQSWSWYSHHDTRFVLSNLCRLYCYNLNNSINSFFQQNKFYCLILLTICLLKSGEKYFFSWKIINKIALRVFEFTTCLFCKLSNLRLTSKWPPTSKKPRCDDWQEIRTLRSVYLPLNPSKLAQQAIIYPIGRQTGKVPAVLKVNFASVVNKKNTKVQHRNLRMISKNSFTLARNKWGTTF